MRLPPERSNPRWSICAAAWLLFVLAGCGWWPGSDRTVARGPDIGELIDTLPAVQLPEARSQAVTREDVMAAYERVYGAIDDPGDNHAVGKRLADLHMAVGEEADLTGSAGEHPYAQAVQLYEQLLEGGTDQANDEILYQLSRVHDLSGETDRTIEYLNRLVAEYPDSNYVAEARFRRAELAFSRDDYAAAASDYAYIVGLSDTTPYFLNATYMLGWSRFKLGDLDAALDGFYAVIDSTLGSARLEDLPAAEAEVVNDSFRVVTLALAYLDGAATLADAMAARGRPAWQYVAYQRLAADYLNKERFLDSVATWRTFIQENGLDPRAPAAHLGMIRTLIEADFPSEVGPEKEAFVARYGVRSDFWKAHPETVRNTYLEPLRAYLDELATISHAEAQASGKRADYLRAADFYEQIVATSPTDPDVAGYRFLLGEVYTEAGEHSQAVAAYQQVVREHPGFERAPEAGYAAILGLDALVSAAEPGDRALWRQAKIEAQTEFATTFPTDSRAAAVQADAADALFDMGEFQRAVDMAEYVVVHWPDTSADIQRTVYAIMGHGAFELGSFAAAEAAYHKLLGLGLGKVMWGKVQERLLAAVYKQGAAAEAEGRVDDALRHYLRMKQVDPAAELTVKGHFDAVAMVEAAGRPADAAELLSDFRARYADHPLAAGVDRRLAALFEATEDPARAAAEYARMAESDPDAEVRRQALYHAAELYLGMDDLSAAIEYFRAYAHAYPEPVDLNLEAIHHMDLLYQRTGDGVKRRFWLQKMIELQHAMGSAATERATYLAADAQFVLALDERAVYDGLRLDHPLKKSLKKKQRQLKRTLRAFERLADYRVAEFATAATFHIADLYAALSTAIMHSDRPGNLSELELEQYEILLEEQAFPFEEQAIELHEINMRRSWTGVYDPWVQKSFDELGRLMPARFDKPELEMAYVEVIH